MQLFNKLQIKKYVLVLSCLIVFLSVTALVSHIQRDYKDASFKKNVDSVLQAYDNDRFIIGEEIAFTQPINTSVRLYELTDKTDPNNVFVALVRITGLCGAQACILSLNTTYNTATFLGIAGLPIQTYDNALVYGITDSMIEYWKKNLITILANGGLYE